jgi:hypothetical protein
VQLYGAGYFRNRATLAHLRTDPDLAPLHGRADFKSLLEKLEHE